MSDAEVLEQAPHLVAERVAHPAPRVYARLFEREPALHEMFVLDTRGTVRGEMFHRALESLLDGAAGRPYAEGTIAAEWPNHRMNGVTKAQFDTFFEARCEVFRDALRADWSPAVDAAWQTTLAKVRQVTVPEPDAAA